MKNDSKNIHDEKQDESMHDIGTIPEVEATLKEMCRCMRPQKKHKSKSRMVAMIGSWYMPRNEADAMCYMKRYAVWCKLPDMIDKRLNRKEETDAKRRG